MGVSSDYDKNDDRGDDMVKMIMNSIGGIYCLGSKNLIISCGAIAGGDSAAAAAEVNYNDNNFNQTKRIPPTAQKHLPLECAAHPETHTSKLI